MEFFVDSSYVKNSKVVGWSLPMFIRAHYSITYQNSFFFMRFIFSMLFMNGADKESEICRLGGHGSIASLPFASGDAHGDLPVFQ